MMAVFRAQLVVVALSVFLCIPGVSRAETVGTFTRVEGNVDLLRTGESAVVPVRTGDPVSMGDAVRTKRNGKAEIQFRDETVIQLAPETRIAIDKYSFRGDNARERGLIGLFRGKIRAIVSKLRASVIPVSQADAGFSIKTPTAIAGVKGTDLIVYYERGISGVIFLSGNGIVFNPERPERVVPLKAGQATFVSGGTQPPMTPVPVANSFVALHFGETTAALTNGNGNDASDISVDVVALNTTYGILTEHLAGDVFNTPQMGGSSTLLIINSLGGSTGPSAGPTTVPVTDTHPQLLGTPVTVNVRFP